MSQTITQTTPGFSVHRFHSRFENVGLGFGGILRSEWVKARSLSTTWLPLLILIAIGAMLGMLQGLSLTGRDEDMRYLMAHSGLKGMEVVNQVVTMLSAILIPVFAVQLAATEYTTGAIRSTLAAAPRRVAVGLAKGVITAVFSLVAGALMIALTLGGFFAVLAGSSVPVVFEDPMPRMIAANLLGMVIYGLVSVGLALVLRSSAASLTSSIGLFLVLPILLQFLGGIKIVAVIQEFLPMALIGTLTSGVVMMPGGVIGGFIALAAWGVVAVAVGTFLLKNRDA
jgi:ABC-2 type transport system permease protein